MQRAAGCARSGCRARLVTTYAMSTVKCSGCGKTGGGVSAPLRGCSACKAARYCDRACQREHWPVHREDCKRIAQLQNPLAATCRNAIGNPQELFRLKVLTEEERAERMKRSSFWESEEEALNVSGIGEDIKAWGRKQEFWRWEGEGCWDTIEEAIEEGYAREELERELYGWEYQGCYASLEDAIMRDYHAKTVREVAWDYAGVERIDVIWPEEVMNLEEKEFHEEIEKRMKMAGWRYVGYKPGRDFNVNESTMQYGNRTIGGGADGGDAWTEGRD